MVGIYWKHTVVGAKCHLSTDARLAGRPIENRADRCGKIAGARFPGGLKELKIGFNVSHEFRCNSAVGFETPSTLVAGAFAISAGYRLD